LTSIFFASQNSHKMYENMFSLFTCANPWENILEIHFGFEYHSVNEMPPSANVPSSFETQIFFPFSRTKGKYRITISWRSVSLAFSIVSFSIRRPRADSRSAFRTCRKFAEATCRWRFSSYFRGHDSACHGPIVPFFILRRVSTACERKGIRFGFLSDYHNDALQWIRSVYIPNTSLWNAKASLKCWNISDNSTFSILDVAGLNKCC